ncbi:hypothetical protein Pint_32944 [Pistacia integerrima]|uniref:Uncharacterized protein n=1 Tax=Pistacia integerrima TaxID=434235 RepID=A0ACC0X5E7_9ROSI|nr:hypothetical protein Pint_32944 [Pistacia integerrima]
MRLYKSEDDKANLMQSSEPSERLVGLSDDVGVRLHFSAIVANLLAFESNVDRSVDLPAQDEIGNMGFEVIEPIKRDSSLIWGATTGVTS